MKTIRLSFLIVAALCLLSPTVFSQEANKCSDPTGPCGAQPRPMTLAIAEQILAAAKKVLCTPKCNSAGSIVVVDDAGVLIALQSLDGTMAGVPQLTIEKAQTSALWRRPTTVFRDSVLKGVNPAYAQSNFPYMTLSPHGIPLFVNGRIVGGFAHGGGGIEEGDAWDKLQAAVLATVAKLMGKP